MKILQPFRPDIYGNRVDEFSAVAMAVHLGNELSSRGHELGYITSLGHERFAPGANIYNVWPTMPEIQAIAEAFLLYRDYQYDILHIHTANFATFKQISKYISRNDRVICTIHIPANIGQSFWWHREDLLGLLKFPNFRLVCVSQSGSYAPLANVLTNLKSLPSQNGFVPLFPEGFDRVKVVHNGIIDTGCTPVPFDQKINRFMFIAHLMPSKNVKQTLQMAIENRLPCLFVGRRLPHKRLSPTEEAYAASCEELIAANADIITHLPYLPYHDCVREMSLSKCLIVLSELESFGFTPIEAALVGTPTIWMGCQGIDETMEHGTTGFRISRQEYKTWKKRRARAAELFHSVVILDQQEMAEHVRQQFSIAACASNYEALYTKVTNGFSAASNA